MTAPSAIRLLTRITARLAVAALVLGAAAMVALPLAGYERYVITGGSMGGTIDRGSILWAKEVPTAELRVGDVITYTPPAGAGPDGMVTHRIVSIRADRSGRLVFRTKGDANASRDPWEFRLDEPVQARAAFHVPYAGYALALASQRTVRMIGIGIPALLIVLATFLRLWRDAGEHTRAADDAAPPAGSPA